MKIKIYLHLMVAVTFIGTTELEAQNVGINPTGTPPNNSAGLDVDFTNKGLLIPRVTLTSATDAVTIPSPATSLLVYNTGAGGLAPAGYYYNAGTPGSPNWVRLLPASAALTTCGGVLNNYVQKWNGTQLCNSIIFDNGTNVGIGTASPSSKLHVSGEVFSTSGYGDIIYIGGDNAGNDGEVGIQSATRNTITFYNRTQGISADLNMRDILSARNITFSGALMPASNPGTSGQVLVSQGAGTAPVWGSAGGNNVVSVSLASDQTLSSTAWTDVPGMSITFTALSSQAFIMLSASGHGYTSSMSYVQFRVFNVTSGSSMGGTMEKIQSYDNVTGTITTWSCSFMKLMTGLTPGNNYTIKIQYLVNGIAGTWTALVQPVSYPDMEHLTLSVIR